MGLRCLRQRGPREPGGSGFSNPRYSCTVPRPMARLPVRVPIEQVAEQNQGPFSIQARGFTFRERYPGYNHQSLSDKMACAINHHHQASIVLSDGELSRIRRDRGGARARRASAATAQLRGRRARGAWPCKCRDEPAERRVRGWIGCSMTPEDILRKRREQSQAGGGGGSSGGGEGSLHTTTVNNPISAVVCTPPALLPQVRLASGLVLARSAGELREPERLSPTPLFAGGEAHSMGARRDPCAYGQHRHVQEHEDRCECAAGGGCRRRCRATGGDHRLCIKR